MIVAVTELSDVANCSGDTQDGRTVPSCAVIR